MKERRPKRSGAPPPAPDNTDINVALPGNGGACGADGSGAVPAAEGVTGIVRHDTVGVDDVERGAVVAPACLVVLAASWGWAAELGADAGAGSVPSAGGAVCCSDGTGCAFCSVRDDSDIWAVFMSVDVPVALVACCTALSTLAVVSCVVAAAAWATVVVAASVTVVAVFWTVVVTAEVTFEAASFAVCVTWLAAVAAALVACAAALDAVSFAAATVSVAAVDVWAPRVEAVSVPFAAVAVAVWVAPVTVWVAVSAAPDTVDVTAAVGLVALGIAARATSAYAAAPAATTTKERSRRILIVRSLPLPPRI
jgi:hypothetical protein